MEIIDYSNAELWRLMLPASHILFPNQTPHDELIFTYRKWLFFVYADGSTVRIPKPKRIKDLKYDEVWDLLFLSEDVFDYDHEGMFDIGEIMLHIGFMVPMKRRIGFNYTVEIVNRTSPNKLIYTLEVKDCDLPFAIYHGLLYCTKLYHDTHKEEEYMIRQIIWEQGTHNLKIENE